MMILARCGLQVKQGDERPPSLVARTSEPLSIDRDPQVIPNPELALRPMAMGPFGREDAPAGWRGEKKLAMSAAPAR
jgi:hypothetical protein